VDRTDIHNSKRDLKRITFRLQDSSISTKNKKLIMDFHDDCVSSGLSVNRILFYMYKLFRIASLLNKDLDKATKEDIRRIVQEVELNENYAEWTKNNYKVTLKKFYKWLGGNEDYPEKVKWIRATVKKDRTKIIDVLSEDDVKQLIDAADGMRNKALISALYESGCRIGELLNLRFGDINFDDYGAVILVNGKTGPRRVRLVSSVPRLAVWVEHHPVKNPESPLWVNVGTTNHNEAMGYQTVRKMLKDIAAKAGIRKPVNPHAFRHARATHLASKLTEAQMNEYLGWIQGSKMPATYVHLSGKNIDDAILRMNGVIPKDADESQTFHLKKCPRCFHENPPDAHFCITCRLPLDEKTALEVEQRKKEFISTTITNEIIEKMVEEKVRLILAERNQESV
jgi:site-specific recombinase XerD